MWYDGEKKGEKTMRFLIVNDDSIHAPGIAVLARAAAELGEVTVVAPAEQCSAMSQRITIRGSLRAERMTDFPAPVRAAWSVSGTPADCVKTALTVLMEERPDFVLSGVNAGWNVAFDIAHSGTLGAAFEAAMYGVPAIAFSNAHNASLDQPEKLLVRILRELIEQEPPKHGVWNVNFPAGEPKGILRDRTVASVPLFRDWYDVTEAGENCLNLAIGGEPVSDPGDAPVGSDLQGVLSGFVTIGQVRCSVL